MPARHYRYQRLAAEIESQILGGLYSPGARLPSVRKLQRQTNLSVSTILRAFVELETAGLIEARPRSGYYVSPVSLHQLRPPVYRAIPQRVQPVRLSAMINSVLSAVNDPRLLPLGMTVIDESLLPYKHLARILKSMNRREVKATLSYSLSEGDPALRCQISLRTLGVLHGITPEDIVITNGCMEAVALALLATTRPGETVAIESPTNFTFLQLLKELGMLVAEVPTDPRYGIDLAALEKVLRERRIRACLLMPNFHNPLGSLMPAEKKEELARLAARYRVPVIEDDVSAELHFEDQRPLPLKAFDRDGWILTCASFSKTLAPGLRVGWILPGKRFSTKIQNLKAGMTVSTSTLDQHLLAAYLDSGAYERHLRALRQAMKTQMTQTAVAIQRYFPAGTRLALPRGGSLLWVELPSPLDGLEIHRRALAHGIAIIPGVVCSNSGQFANCIQMSCGMPYTPEIEQGIATLGRLCRTALVLQ